MDTSIPAKVLVFRVGDQVCSLPVDCVREVLHRPELVTAPGQPAILEGFLNLRGRAYPVIRLRRLFGLPPSPPDLYAPLMVVASGVLQAALEVDEIEMVAEMSGALREFGEGPSPNECALGVLSIDGVDDVTLLSCDRILLAQETACLRELQSMMTERLNDLRALAR